MKTSKITVLSVCILKSLFISSCTNNDEDLISKQEIVSPIHDDSLNKIKTRKNDSDGDLDQPIDPDEGEE